MIIAKYIFSNINLPKILRVKKYIAGERVFRAWKNNCIVYYQLSPVHNINVLINARRKLSKFILGDLECL